MENPIRLPAMLVVVNKATNARAERGDYICHVTDSGTALLYGPLPP
jgi:hypothetical protein